MSDTSTPAGRARRRIVMIRHAQTVENQHLILLTNNLIDAVLRFQLPDLKAVSHALFELLKFDHDSELSPEGVMQAKSINLLKSNSVLLRSFKPRAILVSSMRRTRQTAGLIFPDAAAETYIECPLLNEAKPMEYIFKGSLLNRIDEFERWLAANDDLEGDIALVGHCQYLKHMLRTPQRLKNCDVYEAIFDESTFSARDDSRECPKEDARWTDVRFMLGSPLAVQHPMDRLLAELVEPALRFCKNMLKGKFLKPQHAVSVEHDTVLEGDEGIMCRICQTTEAEDPTMPFIRPCKCSGSQMYVHRTCLSTWRSTSSSAFVRCEVCGYEYVRSQSAVAAMLSSPNGLLTTTIVFVLMSIAFTGAIASWLLKIKNYDPIARLSGALDMPVFWRSCTWHHPVPSLNPFTNLSYCDPGIAGGIEAALLGSVVVGVFGLCVGLLQEAMGPHRNLIGLMLGPIGWLGSMGERERVRVIMALGSVLAARYVYLQVTRLARYLSLLGESMESYPPSSRSDTPPIVT